MATKTKNTTPGPWKISDVPLRDDGSHEILDSRNVTIADVWCNADARLISAAPEMLKLLKDVVWECDSDPSNDPPSAELIRRIKAAIAEFERTEPC